MPILRGYFITLLDVMLDILQLQVRHNLTNVFMTDFMRVVCKSSPRELQPVYSSTDGKLQRVLKAIGFDYQTIRCSPIDCVIYYGILETLTTCPD